MWEQMGNTFANAIHLTHAIKQRPTTQPTTLPKLLARKLASTHTSTMHVCQHRSCPTPETKNTRNKTEVYRRARHLHHRPDALHAIADRIARILRTLVAVINEKKKARTCCFFVFCFARFEKRSLLLPIATNFHLMSTSYICHSSPVGSPMRLYMASVQACLAVP